MPDYADIANPAANYNAAHSVNGPAQSSTQKESEAGVRLVPRPEDVSQFDAEPQPDVAPGGGRSSGGKSQGNHQGGGGADQVGRLYDEREQHKREVKERHGAPDFKA